MLLATLLAQATTNSDVFGQVSPPPGVAAYNTASGGDIGIWVFVGTLLRVGTVIAGLWVLLNIFLAGFQYITAGGDSGAHNKVKDRITNSVIGLALIVGSYTIAGIIGLLFFGDALFILNPTITGPGTP